MRAALFLLTLPAFSQSLTYSTFLRDHFVPASIATDAAGNVYLAGSAVVDALTGQIAPLVMKLDPQGQHVLYSRFLGGSSNDKAVAIAVDSSGDAFVVGTTNSPDFPVTPGRTTGSLPAATSSTTIDQRAFLVELTSQGSVAFSETIGMVSNAGLAVAVTPNGQILISGISNAKGFASTSGAYFVPDTTGRPYLMELSADGSQVIFSATGIGGNALAFDVSGDIFMAGSTALTDYPTSAGAYQTVFKPVFVCFGFCQLGFAGTNQYVTKVDPGATKLLYSTAVAGAGSTANNGLAVDATGAAYVTGAIEDGNYPYTVTPPTGIASIVPFLTKLNPAGSGVDYSIPIGGAGVVLSGSNVFAGGSYSSEFYGIGAGLPLLAPPAGIANLNPACAVNNFTTGSQTYVTELDSSSGNVLDTVLVDSTNGQAAGIALSGDGSVWVAGTTAQADVPVTPGAIAPPGLAPGPFPGAALAQIAFSPAAVSGAPQLECLLDAANSTRLGPVAPNQLVTLMGANLDGASVMFDGQPATVLYSSATQINAVVPYSAAVESFTAMQVSWNTGSVTRELPVVSTIPAFFTAPTQPYCGPSVAVTGLLPVAMNQDGSLNACGNPAHSGSTLSFFLNGLGGEFKGGNTVVPLLPEEIQLAVTIGEWSTEVVSITAQNDWVWRVNVLTPPVPALKDAMLGAVLNTSSGLLEVGPLTPATPMPPVMPGTPLPMGVWIAP